MSLSTNPLLIVVAGPNGSGKTSLTTRVLQHQWFDGCHYLNPDNIAKEMFGDWNSEKASLQAAAHAEDQREWLLSHGKSMAFETVMSAPDKIDFLIRAKDAGYFIRLFFVGTCHPKINAARVAQRVMEGGHTVPIEKIISRYSKSIANCVAAASIADRAYIYDNSVEGDEPSLLFRSAEGRIVKTYMPIPPWASSIYDACGGGDADPAPTDGSNFEIK